MDTILVLCQSRRQSALIARTLRYRQVYSLPLALDSRAETVLSYAPKGIVLSANDGMDNALAQVDPALLSAGVPVHMLAQVCDMNVGELVHVIADAHIYDRHVDAIKELISRDPFPAPKFWLNPEIRDFYQFTPDDVKLEGYQTGEQIRDIPIAI